MFHRGVPGHLGGQLSPGSLLHRFIAGALCPIQQLGKRVEIAPAKLGLFHFAIGTPYDRDRLRFQSSSASRRAAGASGFLVLIQSRERPEA